MSEHESTSGENNEPFDFGVGTTESKLQLYNRLFPILTEQTERERQGLLDPKQILTLDNLRLKTRDLYFCLQRSDLSEEEKRNSSLLDTQRSGEAANLAVRLGIPDFVSETDLRDLIAFRQDANLARPGANRVFRGPDGSTWGISPRDAIYLLQKKTEQTNNDK